MRILFPILILASSGCGTYTSWSLAQENPKVDPIYGGVRTDINCIFGVTPGAEKQSVSGYTGLVDWVAKPCSVVDLPLSFAADTLMLPFVFLWTLENRPSSLMEGNKAGASEHIPAAQTTPTTFVEPAEVPAATTSADSAIEKSK